MSLNPFREDLPKLKYLTMCMKEAMRKYPPVSLVSRVLEKDVEVDGRIIKAGTQVDVEIYAIHHHPDFWEKPEVNPSDYFDNFRIFLEGEFGVR